MKTIKSILIATTLVCATAVSSLSAQQAAQPAKEHQWKVAVGDSVMIKRECQEYLTGERPSVWVWDKVHTVRQLGTKRFPEGVLLMNIYSWICEECLIPVNGRAQEEEPKAVEEQKEDKAAFEKAQKEGPAAQPAEEPKEEPVAQPAEEPAKEETPAEPQKEEEPTAQTNQGDSIHSKPNFKHNYDRFTIGLRGGAAGLLHKAENGKWLCGGDVVLDLQYAHYWTKDGRPVDLGIIAGVGLGYAQSSIAANVNSTRKGVADLDAANPMHIDYTIRADEVKEHDGQLQLEVPLMFSLIHQNGLFFNIGPKFMLPVFTPYKQTVSNNENTYIDAYYQETGVRVSNDVITGRLADDNYTSKGTDYKNKFTINVMLTAEIGYEWILKSGNSLGLGAYANYSVYNSFKNDATTADPLIQVTTPPSSTSNAQITVNPVTGTYASGLGFFDAGVKLAYHFNFPKKRPNKDAKLF
jgi:hypothetical protein